jgi:hypothetical protein
MSWDGLDDTWAFAVAHEIDEDARALEEWRGLSEAERNEV